MSERYDWKRWKKVEMQHSPGPEMWQEAITRTEGQLPLVRETVKHILHAGRRLVKLSGDHELNYARNSEVALRLKDMREQLEELEQTDCVFQQWDFSIATVDFPSTIAGKDYMICWRNDDSEPAHYHQPGEACAQRRPISLTDSSSRGAEA